MTRTGLKRKKAPCTAMRNSRTKSSVMQHQAQDVSAASKRRAVRKAAAGPSTATKRASDKFSNAARDRKKREDVDYVFKRSMDGSAESRSITKSDSVSSEELRFLSSSLMRPV